MSHLTTATTSGCSPPTGPGSALDNAVIQGNPASVLHSGTHAPSAELCRYHSRQVMRPVKIGMTVLVVAVP